MAKEIQAARRTLLGEIRCALSLLGIGAVLLIELGYNMLRFAGFLLRRSAHRERVRRIMFHGARGTVLAALGLGLLAAAAGCKGSAEPRGAPQSFERQVWETGSSIRMLVDQSDSTRSLEQDLSWLKMEPNWRDNLFFDVRHLFTTPDARKSLELDLQALGDPDHRRHGLRETIQMFGW